MPDSRNTNFNLNRVTLLGEVSEAPQSFRDEDLEGVRFGLITRETFSGKEIIERHRILVYGDLREMTYDISPGELLFVEGSLTSRFDDRTRQRLVEVIAARIAHVFGKPAQPTNVLPPKETPKPQPPVYKPPPKVQERLFEAAGLSQQPYEALRPHVRIEISDAVAAGADVNATFGPSLFTPLQMAARISDPEALKALLHFGAKTESQDRDGNTALHWLFWIPGTDPKRVAEATRILLEAKAPLESKNLEGETPLILAAACNYLESVALLLQANAQPDAVDKNGRDALHRAALQGHVKVVRFLLEEGHKPSATLLKNLQAHKLPQIVALFQEQSEKKPATPEKERTSKNPPTRASKNKKNK